MHLPSGPMPACLLQEQTLGAVQLPRPQPLGQSGTQWNGECAACLYPVQQSFILLYAGFV